MTEPDWATYAGSLADILAERGDIQSPAWRAAVAEVPRHLFVSHVFEQDRTGEWTRWDTGAERRWDVVYSPKTLVTALGDWRGFPEPASSSTNPELMVRMLEILDIRAGQRVLEIGTGTGYNAALLSHRLGAAHVFSVDIDPTLIAQAGRQLDLAGYGATLAALDGKHGFPEHAPYDRIISTCSVPAVPAPWAQQLAPGGGLLVDLKLAISAGNLVHLRRQDNGVLEGRFSTRWASFMAMRHQDEHPIPVPHVEDPGAGRDRLTDAPVPPWGTPIVWFLAQLTGLPRGIEFGTLLDPESRMPTTATLAGPDGSQACVDLDDRIVTETGDTSLWEPIEHAYRIWIDADRPGWERFGLTVESDGRNTVWLDDPTGNNWTL